MRAVGRRQTRPADVARLFKLRDELWTQMDHDTTHGRALAVANEDGESGVDPEQRRREIVRALDEAGVFERLRNLTHDGAER